MKAEEARKLADQSLEKLAAALDQGKSEALTQYLAALGGFHDYSWRNTFLIIAQKPDATHVAGYKAWRSFGRFVRKGEKGIIIVAPMLIRPKEAAKNGGSDDQAILRFRAAHVFDISQTDGDPLPEFASVRGDPKGYTEALKELISFHGIGLEYSASLNGAVGTSHGGRIRILEGLSPAEEFTILTHELAHEMLHQGDKRKETSRKVRETEAEAVAFVVSHAIGLEANASSADYIQLYNGDPDTLAGSLHLIQATAAEIIEGLTETRDTDGHHAGNPGPAPVQEVAKPLKIVQHKGRYEPLYRGGRMTEKDYLGKEAVEECIKLAEEYYRTTEGMTDEEGIDYWHSLDPGRRQEITWARRVHHHVKVEGRDAEELRLRTDVGGPIPSGGKIPRGG